MTTAWSSITTWLEQHAPLSAATVRPPATEDDIRQAVTRLGHDLPDDLLAWRRLADGMSDVRGGSCIPTGYRPLPVAEMVTEYERWLKYTDETCCQPDGTHRHTAGQHGRGFCMATIPICRDVGGDLVVIDLRPDEKRGRMLSLSAQDGHHPARWHSVTEMLTDAADHFTNPGPPHHATPTTTEDGVLIWD